MTIEAVTMEAVIASTPLLWDFAGFDGLALARDQFGPAVSELAAYQSLEIDWLGTPGALLRLCENNFRVSLDGSLAAGDTAAFEAGLRAKAAGRRVWVKRADFIALRLGEEALERLLPITSVKPPHRLAGLPWNRAVPARISGRAALVWRHHVQGAAVVEIQVARADCEAVCHCFRAPLF